MTPWRNRNQSLWIPTSESTIYPRATSDLSPDVVIIGAGITGLTAALLLARAGKKVTVIDKESVACGETGHTTAHVTAVVDSRYHKLIAKFGVEGAREVAKSNHAAIELIESLVGDLRIDCGFERVPAYLYADDARQLWPLRREYRATQKINLDAESVTETPLPFPVLAAVKFPHQAQFHPRIYCQALAKEILRLGSTICEQSMVRDIQDGGPCQIEVENLNDSGGTGERKTFMLYAPQVIVATDSTIFNRFSMHPKVAAYRTYAIASKISEIQASQLRGLFWDLADPYHYTRTQYVPEVGEFLIVGGEDHKVGLKENTHECFEELEKYAREKFGVESVQYRWSGQIMEPVDGLPFIGKSPHARNVYIATGYAGNGMTFGTIAGMVLYDNILGRETEWTKLYDPTRIKSVVDSAYTFVEENVDFPKCFIKDRIRPADAHSLGEVQPGEGKLVNVNGKRAAVYRDSQGGVHAVDPVCTHLGCYVHFNSSERSWDCPCHGSRFSTNGEVLHGPARMALAKVSESELQKESKPAPVEEDKEEVA